MSYDSLDWLPLAAGLTGLGLVLSYLAYRRGGLRPALGAAWSLLPIAAYLTGAIEMLWKMGAAIGDFATDFVFSPERWVGIGWPAWPWRCSSPQAAASAAWRRARRARRPGRSSGRRQAAVTRPASARPTAPRRSPRGKRTGPRYPPTPPPRPSRGPGQGRATAPAPDDDMKDIEDILRKRGTNRAAPARGGPPPRGYDGVKTGLLWQVPGKPPVHGQADDRSPSVTITISKVVWFPNHSARHTLARRLPRARQRWPCQKRTRGVTAVSCVACGFPFGGEPSPCRSLGGAGW